LWYVAPVRAAYNERKVATMALAVRNPNYKQIENLLASKTPFTHQHSMHAVHNGKEYLVYSYRTPIAVFDIASGEWFLNLTKYSTTTSKQQSIVKRVAAFDGWNANIQVPLEVLREKFRGL
jgi:hypothetical protein